MKAENDSSMLASSAEFATRQLSLGDTLHRLKPRGIETPFCESAYSYVQRLAESHRVTLYQLVKFVCEPVPGVFASRLRLPRRLDSVCANSADFISRLSILTRVPEVKLVGLSWLCGRVASNEPLKPGLAWCAGCLRDARECRHPVHGQSAWLFANNRNCVKHHEPLRETCPQCGFKKDPRTIIRAVPLDYCDRCGCDLAMSSNYKADGTEAVPGHSSWDRSAAQQIGEVIANAAEIVLSNVRPDAERLFGSALGRARASSKRGLGQLAGTSASGARFSKDEGPLLSLDVLLRLSIAADVSLAGVLAPSLWSEGRCSVSLIDAENGRRTRRSRKHDWPAIRERVQRGLESGEEMSIKSLAREMDVRPAMLLFRLGELGHSVTRHKRARHSERQLGEADELVARLIELNRMYSYFGHRLTNIEACRNLGLTRESSLMRLALRRFKAICDRRVLSHTLLPEQLFLESGGE